MPRTQLPDLSRSAGARAWERAKREFARQTGDRDRLIRHYASHGYPADRIADAFALSKTRIHQIIAKEPATDV